VRALHLSELVRLYFWKQRYGRRGFDFLLVFFVCCDLAVVSWAVDQTASVRICPWIINETEEIVPLLPENVEIPDYPAQHKPEFARFGVVEHEPSDIVHRKLGVVFDPWIYNHTVRYQSSVTFWFNFDGIWKLLTFKILMFQQPSRKDIQRSLSEIVDENLNLILFSRKAVATAKVHSQSAKVAAELPFFLIANYPQLPSLDNSVTENDDYRDYFKNETSLFEAIAFFFIAVGMGVLGVAAANRPSYWAIPLIVGGIVSMWLASRCLFDFLRF
jgi:hypothetical protein